MKRTHFLSIALLVVWIAVLCSGETASANAGQMAVPTWQPIYLDGEPIEMAAYNINGNNYVKLRDIGQAAGFNVFWADGVQIDTSMPYTGVSPVEDVLSRGAICDEMVSLINEVRAENGVEPLSVDSGLMAAAQDCADLKAKAHDTIAECRAAADHGYPYGFGANLIAFTGAELSEVAARAVRGWVNSPGHFQNIIADGGEHLGVGVHVDGRWTYCYMLVGHPNSYNPYA